MARMKKQENLDAKIAAAQDEVIRLKTEYENACTELKKLVAERDALRQKLLSAAMAKHNKSFEDVMRFIESDEP